MDVLAYAHKRLEEAVTADDSIAVNYWRGYIDGVKRAITEGSSERPSAIFCKDCEYLGIKDFVYGYCKRGHIEGILNTKDGCTRGRRRE